MRQLGYYLYPELTVNGVIHFHGSVLVKTQEDKLRYYKFLRYVRKNIGHIMVKPIDNYHKWFNYCRKDKEMMEKILGDCLPYNTFWEEGYDGNLDEIYCHEAFAHDDKVTSHINCIPLIFFKYDVHHKDIL